MANISGVGQKRSFKVKTYQELHECILELVKILEEVFELGVLKGTAIRYKLIENTISDDENSNESSQMAISNNGDSDFEGSSGDKECNDDLERSSGDDDQICNHTHNGDTDQARNSSGGDTDQVCNGSGGDTDQVCNNSGDDTDQICSDDDNDEVWR